MTTPLPEMPRDQEFIAATIVRLERIAEKLDGNAAQASTIREAEELHHDAITARSAARLLAVCWEYRTAVRGLFKNLDSAQGGS